MRTATVGYTKNNGDFAIIAALNNNDGHLSDEDFKTLVDNIATFYGWQFKPLEVLERQDTPDYITIDEEY
jgi:hypothetical protein